MNTSLKQIAINPKLITIALAFASSISVSATTHAKNQTSKAIASNDVLGQWVWVDEELGIERAATRMYRNKNGTYHMKVMDSDAHQAFTRSFCYECPEPFTGKPILNMTVVWGFKPRKGTTDTFDGGYGIDPFDGVQFRGMMRLSPNKKLLRVVASPTDGRFINKQLVFLRKE